MNFHILILSHLGPTSRKDFYPGPIAERGAGPRAVKNVQRAKRWICVRSSDLELGEMISCFLWYSPNTISFFAFRFFLVSSFSVSLSLSLFCYLSVSCIIFSWFSLFNFCCVSFVMTSIAQSIKTSDYAIPVRVGTRFKTRPCFWMNFQSISLFFFSFCRFTLLGLFSLCLSFCLYWMSHILCSIFV